LNRPACLVMDVDGVLTDGRLWYGAAAEPSRAFHIQDGLAIKWFIRLGGLPVILTGKRSQAVAARAAELGIEHVMQGSEDKLADVRRFVDPRGIKLGDVAMIGDDLPDLPVMLACGYAIAVANAVAEVRSAAAFVTKRAGGDGAVREAIEHLLGADGRWEQVLAHYRQTSHEEP
jgi:3-deoxy-D-manno-octulosonate 8-phosphate phosphatase (KDO 8-P phosphatase)